MHDDVMDKKISVDIVGEMKTSFLDYSMSVIVARALPDVKDGLKPVHRRILYTLYEEGMTPDKKYQKSANAVGAVMGHYHPHGDSAIYDTMVRMAQDFTYRHCLVDGHGNFGSIDGFGAAASRYTEARLAKISMELLRDLNKALSRLMVLTESYPELKANQNFLSLQADLKDCEEKIAVARQFYNDTVLNYMNKVEMFPSNIVASMFGFKEMKYFEITEGEKEAPKVSF